MINLIFSVLTLIANILMNLISLVKVLPLWEKTLVITLFFVPIPFTMEGYLILKAMIVKYINKKRIA